MFNKGDIVYHKQVIFGNKVLDQKEKRPCVVLFEVEHNGNKYVCTCPFTSQIRTFNKRPNRYKLISEPVYSYKKISFAHIGSTRLYLVNETYKTNHSLPIDDVNEIIFKLLTLNTKKDILKEIKKYLEYDLLFEKIEQKERRKLEKEKKREKRRQAKIYQKK